MTCIGRCGVVVWRSDGALVSINEVNLRRAYDPLGTEMGDRVGVLEIYLGM